MIVQISQFHINKLTSMGVNKEEILRAILCHSHNEEENEDLLVWDFLTDADLSTMDRKAQYNFTTGSNTEH